MYEPEQPRDPTGFLVSLSLSALISLLILEEEEEEENK
jgi:hypothetical protein